MSKTEPSPTTACPDSFIIFRLKEIRKIKRKIESEGMSIDAT